MLSVKWSRPIDPQPLVNGDCGKPTSGPVSSHTYAGPVYVENHDEYWHVTTGGFPSSASCNSEQNVTKSEAQGGWLFNGAEWKKTHDVLEYPVSYPMACYLRNLDVIYMQLAAYASSYFVFPSEGYRVQKIGAGGFINNDVPFDSATDQKQDICYEYRPQVGIRGTKFSSTLQASKVFESISSVLNVPSLSVEHSTGNLVIVGGNGYVYHIDTKTKEESDISSSNGGFSASGTAKYIYGKFDMIEKIPCVGVGMADPRGGVWLMTLPSSVCTMNDSAYDSYEPSIAPAGSGDDSILGIPFGDVTALQELGLLPVYRSVKAATVDTQIDWSGKGGERPEIGYLPEDHSAFVAGQTELLARILQVADQPPQSSDFAHHPNLYWLPFLMTGDIKYVRHMELQHKLFMAWRRRPLGERFHSATSGRELAWNLRDLFQLVYLQDRGYTEGDTYRDTYEKTRDFQLSVISNPRPEVETFRVIMWNFTDHASYGWVGWMESFLGIVECRGIAMGFEDWRPLAKFHYENLELRISEWGWKGFDMDQAFAWKLHSAEIGSMKSAKRPQYNTPDYTSLMRWGTNIDDPLAMTPYQRRRFTDRQYLEWPDDKLVFLKSDSGLWYTYEDRAHDAYMWAASAAIIELDSRARNTASNIYQKIVERGDTWEQRHAFLGPE